MAPVAERVTQLMSDLFRWLASGVAVGKPEADAPLIVDRDGVLPRPVIRGRLDQCAQRICAESWLSADPILGGIDDLCSMPNRNDPYSVGLHLVEEPIRSDDDLAEREGGILRHDAAGFWELAQHRQRLERLVPEGDSRRRAIGADVVDDSEELSVRRRCESHAQRYISVSYTHLRAHETVLDLVCRL